MERQIPRSIWFACAAGLVLRLVWLSIHPQVIEGEGVDYVRLAENLWSGNYYGILGGPQVLFPPFYPVMIALVSIFTRNGELAARLVSAVMGALLVLPVSLLAGRMAGARAVLPTAWLVALHPALIVVSTMVLSESTYFTLLFGAIFAMCRLCDQPSYGRAISAGSLFGLAYLTRPEAMLVAFVTALAAAGWCWYKRRSVLFAGSLSMAVLAAWAVLALPYVVYLSWNSGHLRLEGKLAFITMINTRMGAGSSYEEASYRLVPNTAPEWPMVADGFAIRRPQPGELWRLLVTGLVGRARECAREVVKNRSLGWPFLMVMVAAGAFALRRFTVGHLMVGIAGAFACLSLLSVYFLFGRYTLVALPFLTLLGGAGIAWTAAWSETLAARWRPRLPVYAIVCGILLAACVLSTVSPALKIWEVRESQRAFLKDIGQAIARRHDPARGRPHVMGIASPTPFYAGGVLVYLPYTDAKSALAYIESRQPDFIVLSPDERRARPYLSEWLKGGIPHPCAELIHKAPVSRYSVPAVAYRWQCPGQERTSAPSPRVTLN